MNTASAGAIRGGNTHPTAASSGRLYWAMRSAPNHLIRMAIEMARKAGAFFSVVDLLSCIIVDKRPCYDQLTINLSYIIVLYYVLM
jgi:hypothetical protein